MIVTFFTTKLFIYYLNLYKYLYRNKYYNNNHYFLF